MAKKHDKDGGEKFQHDPTFKGPLHKRSCTDIICLFLWIVFIIAWLAIGIVGFLNGDASSLLHPKSSSGQRCGVDKGVENEPYLMFFDVTNCVLSTVSDLRDCATTKICVRECPKKAFIFNSLEGYDSTINDLYCTSGTKEKLKTIDDIKSAIDSGECAAWYIPSEKVVKRCLPARNINSTFLNSAGFADAKYIDIAGIGKNVSEFGEAILQNLESNWPWIVGCLAIGEVLSVVYIILMQCFAGIMVWLSLFAAVGLNAYCIYACYAKYDELNKMAASEESSALFANKDTWMVLLVISCIILVIVLLVLLFLRKRLQIAIALIQEASRAVASIKSTLVFPIFMWILQCLVIAWSVLVTFYLLACRENSHKYIKFTDDPACNEYQNGSTCDPSQTYDKYCGECEASFKYHGYVTYFQIINVFGFLWGMCFVSGLSQMILAGAFATWYWTFKKSEVPFFTLMGSISRTVRYHLGTVAFGSLILAICKFIRLVLEYINEKLSKFDNICIKITMCCLRCCFWCLENFIKFINKNAYIMCAVHGKNFCLSARSAFNLLMRNILRTFVVDKVTDFLLFLGKMAITAAMMALSFFLFTGDDKGINEYNLVPVFIVGIGTFFIASVSFGIYNMAVDTLFLCFLEDLERNDGSTEKPYFMSKKLMSILGKKNKRK